MKTLNLVMIVKNEERCLSHCLDQAKGLVDSIIIVDTGSTDRTVDIARSYGAKLFQFTWIQDFSAARNYALSQSDSDWNLILDADEYLTSGTRQELSSFLEEENKLGTITRMDAYLDGDGISYGISRTTRLLPRGVRFTGKIHEQADSELPRIPIPLIFDHDGYLQPAKAQRNLPLLLEELQEHPNDPYFLYQTACTLRNSQDYEHALPYFADFYIHSPKDANYWKRGMIAYLYTLTEVGAYEEELALIAAEKSRLLLYSDFEFACGVFYMKLVLSDTKRYLQFLPEIEASYLRCLAIGEVPAHQGVLGTGSFKAAYNLGVWYEVSGNPAKAKSYYQMAANEGYELAVKRLSSIQ